jgi:hypothetical protein
VCEEMLLTMCSQEFRMSSRERYLACLSSVTTGLLQHDASVRDASLTRLLLHCPMLAEVRNERKRQ